MNNPLIFFSHIPKTGGSSLKTHLKTNLNKDVKFLDSNHELLNKFKQYENNPDNFIFTIVRNPLDRYVSMLNYMWTWKDMKKWLYFHFGNSLTINQINDFNLDIILKYPIETYNHKHCHHFGKQIIWVNFLKHNKIYKYENGLDKIIIDINEKYNLSILTNIPKINVSNKKFKVEDLTQEQINKLKEVYKEDFKLWETL